MTHETRRLCSRVENDSNAGRFEHGCIARVDCTDVDQLAEQIRDWQAEFAQLSPGAFVAKGLMVPLGAVLVSSVAFGGSLLHRATPPVGCHSIVVRGYDSERFACFGRDLLEGECVVLGAGAEGEALSRGMTSAATISVADDVWYEASSWMGECPNAPVATAQRRTPGTEWTARVLDGVAWIMDAFLRHPLRARSLEVRASMADLMLVQLRDLAGTVPLPRNDRREHNRRRAAVSRARSFIHENLTSPMCLSELCKHAHAQARSLEYGFQEIVGMSPVSYIRTLRLNRVHRLLRSTEWTERTITEIALDCGFWHLSQFAVDYRRFFGESPSAVHRPGQNRRPLLSTLPDTSLAATSLVSS